MSTVLCANCEQKMDMKAGVIVGELADTPPKPYKIWSADMYSCIACNARVICGFGSQPLAEHWQDDFQEKLKLNPIEVYWFERRETDTSMRTARKVTDGLPEPTTNQQEIFDLQREYGPGVVDVERRRRENLTAYTGPERRKK